MPTSLCVSLPLLKPKLKSYGNVPYGGLYSIDDKVKGFVGTGYTFEALMRNVRLWRTANGFPNGLGLQEEVENEICTRYPDECKETDVRVPDLNRSIGFADVVLGLKVLARFKLSGSQLVSPALAEQRAATCAACKWQAEVTFGCNQGPCGELKDLVLAIVGNESTTQDAKLKACGVCKCFNAAAVHMPIETQTADLSDEQRAQFALAKELYGCWKG